MKVKTESEDAESYPTLSDPMDCSLPGSSAHGIFQARVLVILKKILIYENGSLKIESLNTSNIQTQEIVD